MEFEINSNENSLLLALEEANNSQDHDPSEIVVVINDSFNVSENDTIPEMKTDTFNYIRIRGVGNTKPVINNCKLTALKGVYLDNVDITYNTFDESNNFINIAPEAVDSNSDSDATYDFVIENSYVRNAGSLVNYSAPAVSDGEKALPLRNVVVENCTFEECSSTLIDLPCECENVVITHNRYTSETENVHNFAILGTDTLKCKNVEIAFNEMYSTKKDIIPNSDVTAESHFCKIYGNKVSVHDNIYNGFTVKDTSNASCNCEPIYIIGSSNTKVYRNKLENFSVGKGAITLEGVFDKINVSENKIDPGDDTNQDNGGTNHSLIRFMSLGGINVFDGTTKLKIASNDLTYHRNSTFSSQELVSAIYFSGTETGLNNNKFDILVANNDYSGVNHFVRFAQKTSKFNIDVIHNNVCGNGYLDGNAIPNTDLLVVGVKGMELCPNANIVGNKGNVGAMFVIDVSSSVSYVNGGKTKVNIYKNEMTANRIVLSIAESKIYTSDEGVREYKDIDIIVSDNKLTFPRVNNGNFVTATKAYALVSDKATYVLCNNTIVCQKSTVPKQFFMGTDKFNEMKCKSITVIGNGFYDLDSVDNCNGNFVNNLFDNTTGNYFIEGYFVDYDDSDSVLGNYPESKVGSSAV